MATQFVLIGNAENRRVAFFQEALRRQKLAPATVVPWLDVIGERVDWPKLLSNQTALRLESPGENFDVEKALIATGDGIDDGEHHAQRIDAGAALKLAEDHGRIWYPRQWYLGFRSVLHRLERQLEACGTAIRLQSLEDIALMFDKVACQQRLAEAQIPIPTRLGPVHSFDELLTRMGETAVDRVFIKLAHGSSASGVVAYERSGARQQAHTSAEIVRSAGTLRLYNSLKVRCYCDAKDIADLVDTLARERVQVEAWIPKATLAGKRFDLRVVVIGGKARHTVVRAGSSPMTNLHLGNARGDLAHVTKAMGDAAWQLAMRTCERTMQHFPETQYAGIDLLIQNDLTRHAVLEVNAFGDLLPNVVHEGMTTYDAEVAAALADAAKIGRNEISAVAR